MSGGLFHPPLPSFHPFVLSPSSLFVFPPTSRPSCLSLSPRRSISPACILSSKYPDCCRCIGRKRKTQRRLRPITRPPVPRKSKTKADYDAIIARAAGAAARSPFGPSSERGEIFRSAPALHRAHLNPGTPRRRPGRIFFHLFFFP